LGTRINIDGKTTVLDFHLVDEGIKKNNRPKKA